MNKKATLKEVLLFRLLPAVVIIIVALGVSEFIKLGGLTNLLSGFKLEATAVSSSQVKLSWSTEYKPKEGFEIMRAYDRSGYPGEFERIDFVKPEVTTYIDTGKQEPLTPGATYWYWIRGFSKGDVDTVTNKVPVHIPE